MFIINLCRVVRLFCVLMVVSLLASCVKIVGPDWDPQAYTVKQGETLYSIAWRYEKDFREIARWNDIPAPYYIFPGQRLSMVAANASGTIDDQDKPVIEPDDAFEVSPVEEASVKAEPLVESQAPRQRPSSIVVRKGDTLYSIARYQSLSHQQLARWNALSPPYAIYPGKKLRLSPPGTANQHNINRRQDVSAVTKPPLFVPSSLPKKVSSWTWPATGRVVKTFKASDTNRKGIGISGNRGQSIKAAAGGKVVYSGNGLIHYGNLVIIKHSNAFLSAYAYNQTLLVKDGDLVQAGQVIAQMGVVDQGRARLHFEIRKNGKPVDPLQYLPEKKS